MKSYSSDGYTRGQVSVSFPSITSQGPPLTPGPWKAVLIKCSLNPLLIEGELGQEKLMLQLCSPSLCLQVPAMSPSFLLVPPLFLALSLTSLRLALRCYQPHPHTIYCNSDVGKSGKTSGRPLMQGLTVLISMLVRLCSKSFKLGFSIM